MVIKGIIIPSDWNQEGKVIQVAVVTYDEDCYLVTDNKPGQLLADHLRTRVIVQGRVTTKDNLKTIEVIDFSIDDTDMSHNP